MRIQQYRRTSRESRPVSNSGKPIIFLAFFLCALVLQSGINRASAQIALNTANGHYYEAVAAPGITWEEANAAAQARTFQGVSGHLATITSQAENDFIASNFPGALGSGYWLGGLQAAGGVEPAGGWQWVTGEPFTYLNWAPNQPNNFLGQENRLHFLSGGQWDDANSTIQYTGYVVEYETIAPPTPTPVPTVIPTTPPPAGTLRIIGRISDANGNSLGNITVTRSGGVSVLTNSAGYYTFNNLGNGTYTITPSAQGVNFTPQTRTVTLNGSDVLGQNFVASTGPFPPASFSVSGRVSNSGGVAIPGANVTATLQGAPGTSVTVQTNSAGYFTFNGLPAGTYVITPSSGTLNFTPQSRTVTVTNSNLSGLNFVGSTTPTVPTFTLSGRVSNSNGTAIPNVTVTRTGTGQTTATTNSAGYYTFNNVPNGNYTITPSGSGLTFTPPSRSVTVNNANVTNQNFIGGTAAPTFTFTGRITDTNGNPLQNVAVTREGNITVFTNSAGYYTFTGLPAGTYTVVPTLQGVTFSPASRTTAITNANVDNQNFVGNIGLPPEAFSVFGRLSTSNGTALPGSTVTATLQGGPGTVVTAQTNSAGYFAFNGLPRGTYILTPSGTGLSFTPETRTVVVDNSDITGQNFIGTGTPG